MDQNHQSAVLDLAKSQGVIRTKDVERAGIPRVTLTRLVREGRLVRIGRGLYTLPEHSLSEHESLIQVASHTSHGVFCLLTALRFHGLTTQSPFEVWVAIPNKFRAPKLDYPAVRVFRFSGQALMEGVETHEVDGVEIRVYGVAKTVADCFKYRNKIGLDVALEALREAWHEKRVSMDELWHYAAICRVANVMRPYLESLT
jgi:predicted transcriptional regulator of viral defense system